MPLFSRKPKVGAEQFCTDFLETVIFAPPIGSSPPWESYTLVAYNSIVEVDKGFAKVALQRFGDELRALWIEAFSLSWMHHVNDKYAPTQSLAVRTYLVGHGLESMWDAMEQYNIAVARSTTGDKDESTRTGRGAIAYFDTMRSEMFDTWWNKYGGDDPVMGKVIARAANRLGSNQAWKANKTQIYLSFVLTDRLECDVNEEARIRLMALAYGFYEGATGALQEVDISSN